MAKRFTDTNKYKKPFIRGLQGAYKLLWDYLYHDCDHAGIWIVDFDIAQLYIGSDMPINRKDALKYFNADEIRIIEFNDGKKWFIKPFIEFQYGILNIQNRVHRSVITELEKSKINKGLVSSLQGAKDKAKDKDKDKDKDFVDLIVDEFVNIHGNYEVINRGKEREMAGKLIHIYKNKYPDSNSEQTVEGLKHYFNLCVNISDPWLRNNMSLSIIVSKFNEINNILKNGKHKGSGATDKEFVSFYASQYGTDAVK